MIGHDIDWEENLGRTPSIFDFFLALLVLPFLMVLAFFFALGSFVYKNPEVLVFLLFFVVFFLVVFHA